MPREELLIPSPKKRKGNAVMSYSKFVSLAIIAIVSATAVSQARAEEPLVAGSGRIYYWLAAHPDRDAYTGQLTPAAKLSLSELVKQQERAAGRSLQPQPLTHVADTSIAAASKHRRHLAERAGGKTNSQALNAFAAANPARSH
jgi:hypothetical protein